MKIRPVGDDDLEPLTEQLWVKFATDVATYTTSPEPADQLLDAALEHREQRFNDETSQTFVAVDDQQLVGYTSGKIESRASILGGGTHLTVNEVYVLPDYRSRGLGTRLLNRLETWGFEQGCSEIVLEVDKENDGAQRLYRERGYEPSRIRMVLD